MKILGILGLLVSAIALITPAAHADDLYLLNIRNRLELQTAGAIIPYAYGTFEGRFIVLLDEKQSAYLVSRNIRLERIGINTDISRLNLIIKMNARAAGKEAAFEALASADDESLAMLSNAQISALRDIGYSVIPLSVNRTPLFYEPERTFLMPLMDFPSDSLADYVVQDSLYSYVHRLENFRSRSIYSYSMKAARNWIYDKFTSFGYADVRLDSFYVNDSMMNNVFCVKPGTTAPEKIIVVGGHYDSYGTPLIAPGADDNASGTSGVLELARIMKNVSFDKTIIFAAFAAEELGILGSGYMAQRLYEQGAEVEFMLNLDMISYNVDSINDISLFSGPFRGYADLCATAASRVSPDLVPIYAGTSQASDHSPFVNRGYDVAFVIERNYQTNPTYHTSNDLSINMNYPFMTQIVRMAAAAIGEVQNLASPVSISDVRDLGDGHSLRLYWENDCRPGYSFKVVYGTTSANYTDTIDVPAGMCNFDLGGLIEGQEYFLGVLPISPEGHTSLFVKESSGTPLSTPRMPAGFSAGPDTGRIVLTWRPNRELDINHYIISRRDSINAPVVIADAVTDTTYFDETVLGQRTYYYSLTAVDNDFNLSMATLETGAVLATFNRGIMLIDETAAGGLNPSESQQTAFYDSIFAGEKFAKLGIGTSAQKLSRSQAGQFSSIFWFDDDISSHLAGGSVDSLKWYLGYKSNLLLAGWQTISWLAGPSLLGPGEFAYDYLGITRATENSSFDFIGAVGEEGWPVLEVSPSNIFDGVLSNVAKFEVRPEAQIIYRYHSQSGNPAFEGQPVGILYENGESRRISLAFPIYYLTESSAQALMAKVIQYLGEGGGPHPNGDIDGNGFVNIMDIIVLINYLFKNGPAPSDLIYADADGNCVIDLLDISYMIRFRYLNGPEPLKGCLQ